MRDIILPRAPHSSPAPTLPLPIHPQRSLRARQLERGLTLGAGVVNWLHRQLSAREPLRVVRPAYRSTSEAEEVVQSAAILVGIPTQQPQRKVKRAKLTAYTERANATLGNLKHGVKRGKATTKQRLASPLVRVSLVQTALILALFGFVLTQKPGTPSPRQASDSLAASEPIRRYLPSGSQVGETQPFTENLATVAAPNAKIHVWATPWNLEGVSANRSQYSTISAFWLSVQPDGFSVAPRGTWESWDTFRKADPTNTQEYFLTVNGDPNYVAHLLIDPELQKKHITQLLQAVQDHGFNGIDIDYEGLGRQNRDVFSGFIQNLTARFHQAGKQVSVTLEARMNNQVPMDWPIVSSSADQVRIMAYDFHSCGTGSPSPITPIGWLKEVLDYAQQTIPASKLIVGLGNYGCDRTAQAGGSWKGVGVSYDQAVAQAKQHNTPILRSNTINDEGYDTGSTAFYIYQDASGQQHVVHFEDSTSIQEKLALINQYHTAGVIFWLVGLSDGTVNQAQ